MRRRWLLVAILWAACTAPQRAHGKSVVLIGDSIFAGVGGGGGRYGVAFQLQRELKGIFIYNYSAPGATMSALFAPTPQSAWYFGGIRRNLALAVIGLGVNDWITSMPIGYFSAKYDAFLTELETKVALVACVSPIWTGREEKTNKLGKTVEDYRQAIRLLCDKPSAKRRFWSGLAAVPSDPRFFVEGLHPNRRGHRRYAKWLSDRIRETLNAAADPPAPQRRTK